MKNKKLCDDDDVEDEEIVNVEEENDLDGDQLSMKIDDLFNSEKKTFNLVDICLLIKNGIQSIVDDEVTKRFDTEGLVCFFIFLNF